MKNAFFIFNCFKLGRLKDKPDGWQPWMPLPYRPQTEADIGIMKFLIGVAESLAQEKPIPAQDWMKAQNLAAGIFTPKKLFISPQTLLSNQVQGDIPASALQFEPHTIEFNPLLDSSRKPLLTEEQKVLSPGFLRWAAELAYEVLETVQETPKEGRSPVGICLNCGEFFEMSQQGRKQRFCGAKCKSLFRSKTPEGQDSETNEPG